MPDAADDERVFFKLATWAIRGGLLTAAERDTICRRGHRKQWAWASHLARLRQLLAERQAAATRATKAENGR